MPDPLLRVENLVRSFGGIKATDNLSLDVAPGELHAIIGPNGAGKTTLISQLTGQLMPNSGTVQFAGRDVTFAGHLARCVLPERSGDVNEAPCLDRGTVRADRSGAGADDLL